MVCQSLSVDADAMKLFVDVHTGSQGSAKHGSVHLPPAWDRARLHRQHRERLQARQQAARNIRLCMWVQCVGWVLP
jgi:hypothetical protein